MKHPARRRPHLFLKGRSPKARRRLLAIFLTIFGAAAATTARAACVEVVPLPLVGTDLFAFYESAAADFDGDGDTDVVAANNSGLFHFESSGAAALGTRSTLFAGSSGFVVVADLDRDGDSDPVSIGSAPDELFWFQNDGGDPSGWSELLVSSALTTPLSLAAGDLDRDGDADLVATSTDRFAWFANNGAGGGWTLATISTALANPFGLQLADLDRDGDLDVVASTNFSPVGLFWFENSGSGSGWTIHTVATGSSPAAVVSADLDRDGDLDLLVAKGSASSVTWLENNGSGGIWTAHIVSTSVDFARAVGAADLDLDGDLDALAMAVGFAPEELWFENNGAGGGWTRHLLGTADTTAGQSTAVDLDRDGDLDPLFALANKNGSLFVARNDLLHGDALFGAVQSISTLAVDGRSVVTADMDRDGDLDPVIVNPNNAGIDWWANNGSGSAWTFKELTGSLDGGSVAAIVDFDGDGDLDGVGASDYIGALLWFRTNTPASNTSVNIDLSLTDPVTLALADFDGNGTPDVAVGDRTLSAVFWYANDGTPSTGSWTRLTVATSVTAVLSIAASDLDRDGDVDLLATATDAKEVRWYENGGGPTPTWTQRTTVALGGLFPTAVVAGDVDGDGDPDAFVLTSGPSLLWLESDDTPATGSWTEHTIATGFDDSIGLTVADLDGDGDLDAAVASSVEGAAVFLENDGGGQFVRRTVAQITDPLAITAADVDRDGDLDLLVTTPTSLVWVPNLGTKLFDDGYDSDSNTACWSGAVP